MEIDSRPAIGFEVKLKGFEAPFSVYNHQSENRIMIFDVGARVTARYIPQVQSIKI